MPGSPPVGDQAEAVKRAERGRLEPPAQQVRGHVPGASREPGDERPVGRDAGVALVQPSRAGAVAGDHRQKRDQVLAVMVGDPCLWPLLERPAAVVHPPAEVDVAGRADPFGEPPELVERPPPHEQVARRRRHAARAVHALRLIEEVAVARVAGEQGVLPGEPHDAARDGAATLADRRPEVALDEVGLGHAVRVDEQQPIAARRRGPGVAGEVGRRLAGRVHDAGKPGERLGGDVPGRVVGEDQLVAGPELRASRRPSARATHRPGRRATAPRPSN